jgi:amidase
MDPTFLSATELAALIRSRQIGCLELLDHAIARVEQLDGPINAVVVRDFDRARTRAKRLDESPDPDQLLRGVPMTVKESFDVLGLPTTRGHAAARDHRARATSLAVRRFEAAGAVVLGKTNVPVDLADWQSYNSLYGVTSNPWNLALTPGGSSGGAAASLAAGFAALELGSDIGGSVRVPAHYCGVYGHKPTWGLCPNRGDPATSPAAVTDIATLGPMARSAADLALALDLLARPDPDETGLTIALPAPRATAIRDLRVAIWAREPGQAEDPETTATLEALAGFLAREGATVSATARPPFDATDSYHLYLRLLDAAWSRHDSEEQLAIKRHARDTWPADNMTADAIMARAVDMPHRVWLGLNEQRHAYRRAWSAFFCDWDVLLCPVINGPAFPHMPQGETWERRIKIGGQEIAYSDMLFWPGLTGAVHLPSTIAPMGMTGDGLPLCVQIVGPVHGDRTTIAVAAMLETAWQGFAPPPLLRP